MDFREIYTEGITKITVPDMRYAKKMNAVIKLLAEMKRDGKKIEAIVAPFLLPSEHPLASVNGVFNAIFVHGNALGDAMFYGSGAGKMPTASAVAADIVELQNTEVRRSASTGRKSIWSWKARRMSGENSLCGCPEKRKTMQKESRMRLEASPLSMPKGAMENSDLLRRL